MAGMMDFATAAEQALAFRRARNWEQFHNPKDLAISINLEAAELLELFQWSGEEVEIGDKCAKAEQELADIMIYCIYFADRLGIDIPQAIANKVQLNEARYPVEKARDSAKKYDEL